MNPGRELCSVIRLFNVKNLARSLKYGSSRNKAVFTHCDAVPSPLQSPFYYYANGDRHFDGHNDKLLTMQSAGVAPELNLRITQVRKHTKKGSTLALKLKSRRHQKSKTGTSVVPRKGFMSSKKKTTFDVDSDGIRTCKQTLRNVNLAP